MYQAIFETHHFEFSAFGETPEAAVDLLRKAWGRHAVDTGAEAGYLDAHLGDVWTREVRPGVVYRDDSILLDAASDAPQAPAP